MRDLDRYTFVAFGGLWCIAIFLILIVGMAAGCTPEKPKIEYGQAREETRRVPCMHMGYCYSVKFNGKMGFGMSAMCPGHQDAVVSVTPFTATYKDGRTKAGENVLIVDRLGTCH